MPQTIEPPLIPDDPAAESANSQALTLALQKSAVSGFPVVLPKQQSFYARFGGGAELAGCTLEGNGSRLLTSGGGVMQIWPAWQSYREQFAPAQASERILRPLPGAEFALNAGAFRPGDSLFLRLGTPLMNGMNNCGRARRWRFTVAAIPGDGALILDRPLGQDWPDTTGVQNAGKRVSGGIPVRGYHDPDGGTVPVGEQALVYSHDHPAMPIGQAVYVTDGQGCWDELRGEFARVTRMGVYKDMRIAELDRPLLWGYDPQLAVMVPGPHLDRLQFADLTIGPPQTGGRAPLGYFKFTLDLRFERVATPRQLDAGGLSIVSSSAARLWNCDSGETGHGLGANNDVRLDQCHGWGIVCEECCRDVTVSGCTFTGDLGVAESGTSSGLHIVSSRVAGGFNPFDDSSVEDSSLGSGAGAIYWHGDRGQVKNSRLNFQTFWQGQDGKIVGPVAVQSFASMSSPYTGKPSTGVAQGMHRIDGTYQPAVPGWTMTP